jgi:hypothetical protein
LYYSFELGAWHLIVLNSECSFVGGCGKGSRQEAWLKQDLQAHANVCTLAYWHRPRWTSGRHTGSVAMTALWNDLVAAHADVVLNGHNHVYERFGPLGASGQRAPDGVREFVVGTGGASRYPFTDPPRPGEEVRSADSFGVIQLTLRPTSYSWRFVSIAGTFSDSGASRCQQ